MKTAIMPQVNEHPMVTEARKKKFVPGVVHNGYSHGGFYLIYLDDHEPYYDEHYDQVVFSGQAIYMAGQWAQIWNKEIQKFENV